MARWTRKRSRNTAMPPLSVPPTRTPGLRLALYTPRSTAGQHRVESGTTRAFRSTFASSSTPDEAWATRSSVLTAFIGSEQTTMTCRTNRVPLCQFGTSTRRPKGASKSCAASAGLPARAFHPASHRTPPISFGCERSRRPSLLRRVQRASRASRSLRKSNDLAEGPIPTRMWPLHVMYLPTNGKHRVICEVVYSSFYAPRLCPVQV